MLTVVVTDMFVLVENLVAEELDQPVTSRVASKVAFENTMHESNHVPYLTLFWFRVFASVVYDHDGRGGGRKTVQGKIPRLECRWNVVGRRFGELQGRRMWRSLYAQQLGTGRGMFYGTAGGPSQQGKWQVPTTTSTRESGMNSRYLPTSVALGWPTCPVTLV